MLKSFVLQNGKNLNIDYQIEHTFNKGQFFICTNNLVYISKEELPMGILSTLAYASPSMREKLAPCLPPATCKNYKIVDGNALIIAKNPSLYLLKDIQDYFKGAIPPVHVAWILNTIYNVCCFLEYSKLIHGGISTENLFIAPETHVGALLGGWWGAKPKDDHVEPLNRFNALVKKSRHKGDLEAVKAIGIELIGSQDAHDSILDFLHQPSSGDAKADYKAWGIVLTEAFGPRKFVKMDFNEADLYGT